MSDLTHFVGSWVADAGAPFSTHTFTWELEGSRLRGRWLIEAPDSPATRAVAAAGRPLRIELQIGDAWLEDGLLLFHVNEGSLVAEFRLVSESDAIVGAAVHKLPFQVSASAHKQSIEGHRVRLARRSEAAG
jgi:hypothetical protein